MHELSIATELYRTCRAEVDARGGGRIEEVTIEVGELTGVEPALLEYAWEAVVAGGPDAGASLELRWCPAEQLCPQCGPVPERQPGSWLRLCPRCDAPLVIHGGEQLDIRGIGFSPVAREQEVLT